MLFNDKTFAKDLRTVAVKFCRGVKISLSQLDTDSTEEIRLDDLQTLNLEKKKTSTPSTMAIYCLPLDLRYGPWLWALVPQGDPKILLANLEKTMPLQNVLDRNALLTWINEQRQERKLAKLNLLEGDLIAAISAADHPQGVAHQRSALGEMRKIIERRGFRFFGENRVQARDLKEALSRMWLSPSHRDLLLNPELSHLVIMIEKRPEIENMSQILILAAKQRGKLNQWLITPPKSLHKRGASDDKKPDSP